MTPGGYIHVDLISDDPKATRAFYEAAFGWRFRSIPFAGYSLFEAHAPPHGGLRGPEREERPGMLGYIGVDDLGAARARVEHAGGKILGDVQRVPGFGRFLLFQAPGGLVQGIFEERA